MPGYLVRKIARLPTCQDLPGKGGAPATHDSIGCPAIELCPVSWHLSYARLPGEVDWPSYPVCVPPRLPSETAGLPGDPVKRFCPVTWLGYMPGHSVLNTDQLDISPGEKAFLVAIVLPGI